MIEAMYDAWLQGHRLQQSEIKAGAHTRQRMTELFRGHAAYGTLIKNDGDGRYWLDL